MGGSSDDGTASLSRSVSASSMTFKSVLRKRSPSQVSSLLSPRKEVSFDLSASKGFDAVAEGQDEEEQELLEHEQKQRGHLKLPPMKLQPTASAAEVEAVEQASQDGTLSQTDLDIIAFLSTFGSKVQTAESLELLDNIHAGSHDWPKREDWDSLPAYLMAAATTFLSTFSDDSAALVYSAERAPVETSSKKIEAPILGSHPLCTSMERAVVRIASWEQPLVSAGVSSFYGYAWAKSKLAPVVIAGLAILLATQGTQTSSTSKDQEELSEIYSKIAPILLGSESTQQRVRNLAKWRSPRASLRFFALVVALALGASRFASGFVFSLPGLLVGLALFVWLPAILHQPEWAPTWLKQGNLVDAMLYDVPTDAQHAILTLRRRAAGGEQLVHRADAPAHTAAVKMLPSLSPTNFDHRVSAQELQHVSDVLEGAHFATYDNEAGHLIVLASRVIFRTLAGKTANEEPISFADELIRERALPTSRSKSCKITLDARLEKVVRMDKTHLNGLQLKLKNGQEFKLENVQDRDQAFNRILALAPQKWH